MLVQPDIATTAALIGDPARAAMLVSLLDRPSMSAGQLAAAANVSPQTASFHLSKLTAASLITATRRGRNQLYSLGGPSVAAAIESLAALSSATAGPRFRSDRMRQLQAARTCYDHLAGIAGVRLHKALYRLGYLTSDYVLTSEGRRWFAALGGSPDLMERRAPFARHCIDWTEREPHLAGRLAAFLLDRFFNDGWIARIRDTRAVRITDRGRRGFEKHYGLVL